MRLLHYIDLSVVGGVEHQFLQFMDYTRANMHVKHAVIAAGGTIHRLLRDEVAQHTGKLNTEKNKYGLRLPKQPFNLRAAHHRAVLHQTKPDAVLLWNKGIGDSDIVRQFGPARCIFWDRSSSWGLGPNGGKGPILPHVKSVISNSRASQRMLQLRWQYSGDIAVCRNALRPNMMPEQPTAKTYPQARPIKIGVATRLESQKGVNLTLHTLQALHERGVQAQLHIAGTGGEESALRRTAEQLGLGEQARFLGHVRDMRGFYESIDCLLHLPICEPLAGVCVEALAHGCPVITANIDGAEEVIREGETGNLIAPRLSISEYCALGGNSHGLPPYVYDPTGDAIREPAAVDPEQAAAAIAALFEDEDNFQRISANAVRDIQERFAYPDHVQAVMAAVTRFAQTGSVRAQTAQD